MIKSIKLLFENIFSNFQSLIATETAPVFNMDDGPLSTDYIAQINAEAKKFIPTDE